MEKVEKMIKAYNEKARKWGFEELTVDNSSINSYFKEKEIIDDSFFKKIKILYQNGYMKEDYEKIKKALN